MSENTNQNPGEQQENFTIGEETSGSNLVNFPVGCANRAELTAVKAHEIGKKGVKFPVIDFIFKDPKRIMTFVHREFIPKGKAGNGLSEKEDYDRRKGWFNSRIKHLYETYAPWPTTGLGGGVKSWEEMFKAIETAFNTNNDGKEIFLKRDGDKVFYIPVFIKNTFDNDNDIQFPLLPNFIEKITPESDKTGKPITLQINKYDKMVASQKATNTQPGVMGSNGIVGGNSYSNTASPDGF